MKKFANIYFLLFSLPMIALLVALPVQAADDDACTIDQAKVDEMIARATAFLKDTAQDEDGAYSAFTGIGATAVITLGLLEAGVAPDEEPVAKSLEYLKQFVQKDGGIYKEGSFHRNYETCLAMQCFLEANDGGRYDDIIEGAIKFVKGLQWGADGKLPESDDAYGGAGYGTHQRPDMSNTSFFIDALHSAGVGTEDEAMQRALIFVSRCQNLESPHNTTKFASLIDDGGFYYTIAAGGSSKAGETANGGLRSYASMTYAGLKSYLYAGVDSDDPRVKAALEWIGKHYDLETNPGLDAQGLYYYYFVFAKTLDTVGIETITDADGAKHCWRKELVEQLASEQRDDGSWINTGSDRWMEGDPGLVTSYALLALARCLPDEE